MSVGFEKREEDGYNSWTYATNYTFKGTVRQTFSPSFACDFHGRKRDKFYICSQALLIIYHEVKGGEGEKGGGLGDHMVFIVAREYTDGTLN